MSINTLFSDLVAPLYPRKLPPLDNGVFKLQAMVLHTFLIYLMTR